MIYDYLHLMRHTIRIYSALDRKPRRKLLSYSLCWISVFGLRPECISKTNFVNVPCSAQGTTNEMAKKRMAANLRQIKISRPRPKPTKINTIYYELQTFQSPNERASSIWLPNFRRCCDTHRYRVFGARLSLDSSTKANFLRTHFA